MNNLFLLTYFCFGSPFIANGRLMGHYNELELNMYIYIIIYIYTYFDTPSGR